MPLQEISALGFCWVLGQVCGYETRDIDAYPELIAHKPDYVHHNGFWWAAHDRETRIAILKEILKGE